MKYRFFEHTADAIFEAYGRNLNELFENAALAVEEIQVNTRTIAAKKKKTIKLENENPEMLLFDFLQELIYLKDAEQMLFKEFQVKIVGKKLVADCFGEKIDQKKHELKVDAKAITLYKFELKKIKTRWTARVLVDI